MKIQKPIYTFRIENRVYYVRRTNDGFVTKFVPYKITKSPALKAYDRTLELFCAKTGMSREQAVKYILTELS